MSKEREFFQRIVDWYDDDAENVAKFVEEIRYYLAQPEKKREALSDEEAEAGFYSTFLGGTIFDHFMAGVRFAERHHGIGGEG